MLQNQKELVGASTALLILRVLVSAPSYGYQIVKRMNDIAGDLFQWQEGTVYPVLHKLEQEKLIRGQWQTADSGRKRKYYYITAKGREALQLQTEQWKQFDGLITRFMEVAHGK
ncbi:MAG: PadR family transcriptional regulator [bacterium]